MAAVPEPVFRYTISYLVPDINPHVAARRLDAAYFVEEGAFTVLKDGRHKALFAVRTEFVVAIERGPAQ